MAWAPLGWGSTPPPMGGHSTTVVGNALVIFGGNADLGGVRHPDTSLGGSAAIDSKNTLSSSVYVFDTDRMSWDQPDVHGISPTPRYSHTAALFDDRQHIIMFGGAHLSPLNDIHVLSMKESPWQWRTLAWKGPAPVPRYGHTSCIWKSTLLVFGGTTKAGCINELLAITVDLAEGTATAKSVNNATGTIPIPRAYHAATLYQDYMIVFGGKGAGNVALNDTFAFDCKSLSWHQMNYQGDPPSPRYNHACTVWRSRFYVHGGCAGGTEYRDDAVVLELTQQPVWTRPQFLGRTPTPRSRHTLTAVGDRIFIFGGTNAEIKLGDVHVLDLAYTQEIERVQERMHKMMGYYRGQNLDQLSVDQLDELEQTMLVTLRGVSQTKKLKMEQQHRQEIAVLKRRLGEAVPASPVPSLEHANESSPQASFATPNRDQGGDGDARARPSSGKKIRFGEVEVRMMNRVQGDGVPRSGSAPLGLGWDMRRRETKSIEEFEAEKRPKGVGPVPEDRRQQMLLKAGVPAEDLERERSHLAEVLRGREESISVPPPASDARLSGPSAEPDKGQ